jgi:hypothetical protein
MGRLNVPSARDALLSFIDPEAPWIDVNINFGLRNTQLFARVCQQMGVARSDAQTAADLLE